MLKFKGEEGYALFGLFAGIIGAAIYLGVNSLDPRDVPDEATTAIKVLVVATFLLAMIIKFISIFTHHAVFTINGDDFILGAALGFDIPIVISQLVSGQIPFVE